MKILTLCLGNICRSPLAEGILRNKLPEYFEIDSAGTISYHEGSTADHRSIKVAKKHGIDISHHRARKITPKDLEYFDKIFCMDKSNLQDVLSMAETDEQKQKISLILEQIEEKEEVPDPYYGDIQDFEKVYQLLDLACDKIVEQLQKPEK